MKAQLLLHSASIGDVSAVRESLDVCDVNTVLGLNTALFVAAQEGHVDVVTLLLERGADVAKKCSGSQATALVAAAGKWSHCTRLLIAAGADVNVCDTYGSTPLHEASFKGNVASVSALLRAKAQVDPVNNSKKTPIAWAILQGKRECVQLLLEWHAAIAIDSPQWVKDEKRKLYNCYAARTALGKLLRRNGSKDLVGLICGLVWETRGSEKWVW